jgi:hypothetical protein
MVNSNNAGIFHWCMVEEDGGVQMVMLVDNTELDIQENRRV